MRGRAISAGLLWLVGLALLSPLCHGKPLTLDLSASSTEPYGPGHEGDQYSSPNITIELPSSGSTGCISLKGLAPEPQVIQGISYDEDELPAGSVVTLWGEDNCTRFATMAALFPEPAPFTVIPGTIGGGIADGRPYGSLQIHVPLPGGVIQDGFYNIKTGNNFDTGEFYPGLQSSEGCLQTLSGNFTNVTEADGSTNDAATFVARDSIAGTEQFLFQLVKAPNQYTISLPRGRTGVPAGNNATLEAPQCADSDSPVRLAPTQSDPWAFQIWTLSSVSTKSYGPAGWGFQANISSAAYLPGGPCAADGNVSTLGVVPLAGSAYDDQGQRQGQSFDTLCFLETQPYLIPGNNVTFGTETRFAEGGWAILPVTPSYCQEAPSFCRPYQPTL